MTKIIYDKLEADFFFLILPTNCYNHPSSLSFPMDACHHPLRARPTSQLSPRSLSVLCNSLLWITSNQQNTAEEMGCAWSHVSDYGINYEKRIEPVCLLPLPAWKEPSRETSHGKDLWSPLGERPQVTIRKKLKLLVLQPQEAEFCLQPSWGWKRIFPSWNSDKVSAPDDT